MISQRPIASHSGRVLHLHVIFWSCDVSTLPGSIVEAGDDWSWSIGRLWGTETHLHTHKLACRP